MALLDFTRFGIKEEDILNGAFNYIIGFDLGHGELAASYWNLHDHSPKYTDLVLTVGGATKIYSALFHKNAGEWVIGTDEVRLPSVEGELYTCFKVKPSRLKSNELYEGTKVTKKWLMQEMLLQTLKHIKAYNASRDFTGRGILAIGCPSSVEWASESMSKLYADILKERIGESGLDLSLVIMPESRASLLKIYKESQNESAVGKDFIERFHRGVMAEDHGSSTLDSTAIDFTTNTVYEESIPLGGAMVEDTMLRQIRNASCRPKEDIQDYELLKLTTRGVKEAYYLSPRSSLRVFMDFTDGGDFSQKLTPNFMGSVTGVSEVAYSTDEIPMVRGTWEALHKAFLEKCKAGWLAKTGESDFKGIVLLTGGASHMDFTVSNAKAVFPQAEVILDKEPSYCVSRGLAYAVRADLDAVCLIHQAKEKIAQAVKADLPALRQKIAKGLAPIVYDYMEKQLKAWVADGKGKSLDAIMKEITKEFSTNSVQSREVEANLKQAFTDYLNLPGEKGLRSIIIKTVNDLFESTFPGKISERSVNKFSIDPNEWAHIMKLVSSDEAWGVKDALINQIDIESTITRTLKNNFFVVMLVGFPLLIVAGIVDWIFDTKWQDKVDDLFTENRFKVCSKEERQKVYKNLVDKKDDNMKVITETLKQSCISADKEQKIADRIVASLEGPVNKAVDNVSLYF